MNTLKIECSKNDYIIKTAKKVNTENELIVDIPEDWNSMMSIFFSFLDVENCYWN